MNPTSMKVKLDLNQRERAWACVIKVMAHYPDQNDKAILVQNAICELGPVPNSMGEEVRNAIQQNHEP